MVKRSDVSTYAVLSAVAEGNRCSSLFEAYPAKVVYAALEREIHKDLVDYGVTMRSGFLTPEGHRKLAAHNAILEAMVAEIAELQREMDHITYLCLGP